MSAAKVAREKSTDNLVNNLLPQVVFTETPSDSILCLLCKNVLRSPMQLSCGHRVCKACNENSLPIHNGGKRCPDDGEVIERVFPDMSALIDIMHLGCFCVSQREGCTWQGIVLDLEDHVSNCDFCVEGVCPYHEFQCHFTGSRGKINKHLKEENAKHECLLAICLKECLNEVDENNKVLTNIKEGTLTIESTFIDIHNQMLMLENKLSETTAIVDDWQNTTNARQLKERFDIIEELLSRSSNKKAQFIAFHNKFKDLLKNMENQMKHLNESEEKSEVDKTLSNTKTPVAEKVKRLHEFNESHGKQINELGIKIRIAQCSSNNGHYTWKLDNFRTRLSDAQKGKVRELYTPPLYTSNFGYKYSAKVMLAGDKSKNNNINFMGFYIVLMQGDYDEILRFPFPYPIEITLINFGTNPSITHILYPDPNKAHFEKPFKNMNPAIGFARFCTMERLKNDGFIKNDTIYFNIIVRKGGIHVNEPDI